MSNKHNFILSLDGDQKSFYLQNPDVSYLCRLIRSVYEINRSITALMDAQGNVCDLEYFCQNIHTIRDRFFIILTERKNRKYGRSQRRNKSKSPILLSQMTEEEPSYFIVDFMVFLQEMATIRFKYYIIYNIIISPNQVLITIVLVFDNEGQANSLGQPLVLRIYKEFPYLQAYYTIVREEESESLLVSMFENEQLIKEQEVLFNQYIIDDVIECLQSMLASEEERPQSQSQQPQFFNIPQPQQQMQIPLIVTRGDQRQVLAVEPNDNFHSSQGKRTHGVMRVKKALEKVRDKLTQNEYEYILGLIIQQDQNVFAAYQIFQRTQDDEHFIQTLRRLIPENNNNLSFQNNIKLLTSPSRSDFHQSVNFTYHDTPTPNMRSVESMMDEIQRNLDTIEVGMLKWLRNNIELNDLVKGLFDQEHSIVIQIVRGYLKEKYHEELRKEFKPEMCVFIEEQMENKLSPIHAGILDFGMKGDLREMFDLFKENCQGFNQVQRYSYYLIHKPCPVFHFHLGGEIEQQQEEEEVDQNELQQQKELNVIDKFHTKVLQKNSDEEYEKLFLSVYEQCQFFDEIEKNKLINFYQQSNQRLLEILDRYGKQYDFNATKQDLNDLLTLQNKRYDEISSPTNSANIEPKMQKLKNFKFLVDYFYEIDKKFTLRQIKAFFYLYASEDLSVLSAYEVYCETKDQEEFIQTLQMIYKVYSCQQRYDFIEIESFDSLIEQQLNILFAYRRFFNIEQRNALERNMRAGDNTLLKLFKVFLKSKDQAVFIQNACEFANQKIEEMRSLEQMEQELTHNHKARRDQQIQDYKENIQEIYRKFLKNSIKYLDILMDAAERDHIMIKSAFEIFEQTRDLGDLSENLQLIYNQLYKTNVRSILKAVIIQLQGNKTDLTQLLKKIDQDDPILKGAFELYFQTKDEQELKDTIHRILKFSNLN